jgi:hypothetical protein
MSRQVSRHLQLYRAGIAEDGERGRIIAREIWIARMRELLNETEAQDFDAYLTLRASLSVFDLIEIAGEEMKDALTKRGSFKPEEMTLIRSAIK